MIGSWISIRIRSGRCFAIAASASTPFSASVISQSVGASTSRMIWRLSGWSSTTRMRLLCRLHLLLDDDGEREGKSRALTRLRLDPDLAAVHLNDPLGNGQSQAGATFLLGDGIVGLLELLKQLGLVGCGDSRSGVADRHME